jgi:ABC-type arginine transport system ATPase subunit
LFPRLAERRGQLAATLFCGEQQMAAIARALMAQPSAAVGRTFIGSGTHPGENRISADQEIKPPGRDRAAGGTNLKYGAENAHRAMFMENGVTVMAGHRRKRCY